MSKKKNKMKRSAEIQKPNIVLSQKAIDIIRSESSKSGKNETGGLLLGEKKLINNKYVIIVNEATGPGSDSKAGQHYYITDRKYMQSQLRSFLNQKGLVYVGEWHKHPAGMTSPSLQDLYTMKEIVSEDITKDILTIISTEDDTTVPDESIVQYNCFYFQKGMKSFIKIDHKILANNVVDKNIENKEQIKKINLDIEYLEMMFKNKLKTFDISGQMLRSGTTNFFVKKAGDDVKAMILYPRTRELDIDFNKVSVDVFITVSRKNKKFYAKAWILDSRNGEFKEIEVEIIDIHERIYKRLSGLNIVSSLTSKNITLIGAGSVGSTAAVQLIKAGVSKINLIDPDKLKLHNICRHVCDMNDLDRFKVEALKDKLRNINPNSEINDLKLDVIKDFENVVSIVSNSDLIIVSTDTPDSRMVINMIGVEHNIPMIFISLHERAQTGKVERFIPGKTQCRACIPGRNEEFMPGSTDYSEKTEIRDIMFQPGLDTDISIVTLLGVKSALNLLTDNKPDIHNIFESGTIFWNGYNKDGESPIMYAHDREPNPHCDICSVPNDKNYSETEKEINNQDFI